MTARTPSKVDLDLHPATRDLILSTRTGSLDGYSATSDLGGSYAVLGPVPGDGDRFYAQSRRIHTLVLVTRTGSVPVRGKGGQVRVRIEFAVDTGDAEGTLVFPREGSVGGLAPRVLFADGTPQPGTGPVPRSLPRTGARSRPAAARAELTFTQGTRTRPVFTFG